LNVETALSKRKFVYLKKPKMLKLTHMLRINSDRRVLGDAEASMRWAIRKSKAAERQ
jgi:hypothetical protein